MNKLILTTLLGIIKNCIRYCTHYYLNTLLKKFNTILKTIFLFYDIHTKS